MHFISFYDIYWTNLLTSATMPVSVYHVCLLQKKSKSESARKNLEKLQKFKNTRRLRKPEGEQQKASREARQGPGAGPGLPAPGDCLVTPCTPSRRLFAYKSPPDLKVMGEAASVHKKFRSSAASRKQVSGDRSLCSGTLPGRGSAPGVIAIDSTAISIAVADSHDDEGVVLPRG